MIQLTEYGYINSNIAIITTADNYENYFFCCNSVILITVFDQFGIIPSNDSSFALNSVNLFYFTFMLALVTLPYTIVADYLISHFYERYLYLFVKIEDLKDKY